MFINEVIDKMTDQQYKELVDSCTPVEKIFMGIARDGGARIYTSEMCPRGIKFSDLGKGSHDPQDDPYEPRLQGS